MNGRSKRGCGRWSDIHREYCHLVACAFQGTDEGDGWHPVGNVLVFGRRSQIERLCWVVDVER